MYNPLNESNCTDQQTGRTKQLEALELIFQSAMVH